MTVTSPRSPAEFFDPDTVILYIESWLEMAYGGGAAAAGAELEHVVDRTTKIIVTVLSSSKFNPAEIREKQTQSLPSLQSLVAGERVRRSQRKSEFSFKE